MGKYAKGYQFSSISKKKAKAGNYGEALSGYKDLEALKSLIREALKVDDKKAVSVGKVFGLYEQKELKGYCIFTQEKMKKEMFDFDFSDKEVWEEGEVGDEVPVYKMEELYLLPECESMREAFCEDIKTEMKDSMDFFECKIMVWGEDVFIRHREKKGFNVLGLSMGLMMGVSMAFSTDNLAIGVCIGFLWAMVFNFTITETTLKKP